VRLHMQYYLANCQPGDEAAEAAGAEAAEAEAEAWPNL